MNDLRRYIIFNLVFTSVWGSFNEDYAVSWWTQVRSIILALMWESFFEFDPDKILMVYWYYEIAVYIVLLIILEAGKIGVGDLTEEELEKWKPAKNRALWYMLVRNATVWVLVYHTDLKKN